MNQPDPIKELEAKLAESQAQVEQEREHADGWRKRAYKAEEEVAETRQQFAELKERVATLGALNAEMRGYIGRVQEDDVVREDLVQTGDLAGGESYLSPKRKHRRFDEQLYEAKAGIMGGIYANESTRRRKHWVNY